MSSTSTDLMISYLNAAHRAVAPGLLPHAFVQPSRNVNFDSPTVGTRIQSPMKEINPNPEVLSSCLLDFSLLSSLLSTIKVLVSKSRVA
jgi:hypothetical protein